MAKIEIVQDGSALGEAVAEPKARRPRARSAPRRKNERGRLVLPLLGVSVVLGLANLLILVKGLTW